MEPIVPDESEKGQAEKPGYTPGPWKASMARNKVGDQFPHYWQVDGPNNAGVADVFGEVRGDRDENGENKYLPNSEIEANARLIAAAPDLLAACRVALSLARREAADHPDRTNARIAVEQIALAIAKAEGRAQ